MKIIKHYIDNLIHFLENGKYSFQQAIWTFFFAITLRNFIELFSDLTPQTPAIYFHYYMSYLTIALGFILLFYWCTKVPIIKISKLVSSFFLVIISAPLVDLFLSGGKGFDMSYFMLGIHSKLEEF